MDDAPKPILTESPSEAFAVFNHQMEHGDELDFEDLENAFNKGALKPNEYQILKEKLKKTQKKNICE